MKENRPKIRGENTLRDEEPAVVPVPESLGEEPAEGGGAPGVRPWGRAQRPGPERTNHGPGVDYNSLE